jgi:hypothetical protein
MPASQPPSPGVTTRKKRSRRESIPPAERCKTCDGTGHGLGGMWCIPCGGTGRALGGDRP